MFLNSLLADLFPATPNPQGWELLVWNLSMTRFSHLCSDVDNLPSMHHNSTELVVRGGGWEWGWNKNKKTLVLSLI